MMKFATDKINDMLFKFYRALPTHPTPNDAKYLVFRRLDVLKAQGYCEDVAFAIALKDYNFSDCV